MFADLTVKVVQAGNTIAAREAARLQPGQENDPIRTRVWREINAALEVAVKRKNQHYHDEHVRVLKKWFLSEQRLNLCRIKEIKSRDLGDGSESTEKVYSRRVYSVGAHSFFFLHCGHLEKNIAL